MCRSTVLLEPTEKIGEVKGQQYSPKRKLGDSNPAFLCARYVLSRCYQAYHEEADEDPNESGWVRLHSLVLSAIAGGGQRWKKVLECLQQAGAVECDRQYGPKAYSRRYRLTPDWAETGWDNVVVTNWKHIPILLGDDGHIIVGNLPKIDEEDEDYEMRRIGGLELDRDLAKALAKQTEKVRTYWKNNRLKVVENHIANFSNEYRIGRTGRMITPLHCLPRPCREAVLLFGEPTCEVDVANSQPAILSSLYPPDSVEGERYKTLAETGNLYAEIMKKCKIELPIPVFKKEVFIPWLFRGDHRKENIQKVHRYMKRNFPILAQIVKDHPREGSESLSHKLQRIEAELVWHALEKEGIANVSIHDSARVRYADKERAIAVIKAAYASIGVVVKVTEKQAHAELLEANLWPMDQAA